MSHNLDKSSTWSELPHHGADKKRRQWSGWIIMAGFFMPMVLAYVIFSTGLGLPDRTINHGDLLTPATSLAGVHLTDIAGHSLKLLPATGEKKWHWLIVGNNTCLQACQDLLYLSRQVHIRLGEKAHRLERIYLNTDALYSAEFANQLHQDHPRLVMAHVNARDWQHTLAHTGGQHPLNGETLYVVDQEGFAMMTYSAEHEGNDLLDDIKRLLKYSYEDREL